MNDSKENRVYLVTGISIAIDDEDDILIAGMLSDSPLTNNDTSENSTASKQSLIGSFALTRGKARFLRDRLNEFLGEETQ